MAAIVWADVVAMWSSLSSIGDTMRVAILEHVNARLDVSMLDGEDGPDTRLARMFLAAHLATSLPAGGTSSKGPVSSESMGGLSRSYSIAAASSSDALGSTTFGRQYLNIIGSSWARLPTVSGGV